MNDRGLSAKAQGVTCRAQGGKGVKLAEYSVRLEKYGLELIAIVYRSMCKR